MPISEIETHPYLDQGAILNATKLILGSFPVYECTNPDNDLKRLNRVNEGTIRFFYGSVDSNLWKLYAAFIDDNITLPPNPDAILASLTQRSIAISDTIVSCQRHSLSSCDSRLIQKNWNRQGIINIINNGASKIICTSKGVLSNLERNILCPAYHPIGSVNTELSTAFQDEFVSLINGNAQFITNPIARVFNVGDRIVKAIAIPSPGSPQRKIKEYGLNAMPWHQYANNYYSNAFSWFLNN